MPEKIVYNPKEDAKNQRNARTKEQTKKAVVYPQPANPTKTKNEKDVVDTQAHAKNGADVKPDERVTEFKAKVNKYGFLRVPKGAWSSLPFGLEKPLIARIEGEHLTIAAATESQPE